MAKTFSASAISEASSAGVRDIGENYVQELLRKQEELPDRDIRWHFIGRLQTNKVKHVVDRVALIHSVDRQELAQEIERRASKLDRIVDVLVEVNTTGEESKTGVAPESVVEFVRTIAVFPHLRIDGLMTIALFGEPEDSRPMFRTLRALREAAAGLGLAHAPMRHLSMGMTGDFEPAIEEGATIIRIGTAIFGRRPKPA